MAWLPISGFVPQATESGNQAENYVLKFYEPGTTTPKTMSTNSTGTPTTTSFVLNAQGYTTLSSVVVVPFSEGIYKEVLYLNQADADANNTGSAVFVVDNLNTNSAQVDDASITLEKLYDITTTKIIIGTSTGNAEVALSGDATMDQDGVITIISNAITPPGVCHLYAGITPPAGYLLMDGSAISRTTYAALFAAIGTLWGEGDGSTTFNIPAAQGYFPRFADNGAAIDPDAASRTASGTGGATGDSVGTLQAGAVESHEHGYNGSMTRIGGVVAATFASGNDGKTPTTETDSFGGNETRPKNLYFQGIIKT